MQKAEEEWEGSTCSTTARRNRRYTAQQLGDKRKYHKQGKKWNTQQLKEGGRGREGDK
jgi:hypothetical protein